MTTNSVPALRFENFGGVRTADTDECGGTRYIVNGKRRDWTLAIHRTEALSSNIGSVRVRGSHVTTVNADSMREAIAIANEYATREGQSNGRMSDALRAAYDLDA